MSDDRIRHAEEDVRRKCDLINEAIRNHVSFKKKPVKRFGCGLGFLHKEKAFTLPEFGQWFPLIQNRLSWHVCRQCGRVTTILDKITSFSTTKLGYIQALDPEKVVLMLIKDVNHSGS